MSTVFDNVGKVSENDLVRVFVKILSSFPFPFSILSILLKLDLRY